MQARARHHRPGPASFCQRVPKLEQPFATRILERVLIDPGLSEMARQPGRDLTEPLASAAGTLDAGS